jgi:hypothetical protein
MFRVEWLQVALDELAAIWVEADATRRREITAAANYLERQLTVDPYSQSTPHGSVGRILFWPPLGITFRIEADAVTVTVLHAWIFHLQNGQQQD